ncbi:hypothetical protein ACKUB1_09295 [Methanospirillum stamsii]|uniref:Uncharacterized protein n=1 Tax=Methanospirillum stamsii TaxID=1277351 RepID=A0A2V2N5R3_9EURY|nr:hypothetical protein [Methanospirillum stamsii]PWR75412.1 hypothetical protein DLD82_04555 [Methanospirillum stamsii]
MKGFRQKPSEKKEETNWTKIGIVVVCVLMAVFMVVSMFGMSWLNIFTQAKPGNSALVDFTFLDAQDRPVLSSVLSTITKVTDPNLITFKANALAVRVNTSTEDDLVPVQAVNPNNAVGVVEFGLFGPEIEMISSSIEGMRVGESKTITNPYASQMARQMSLEQFVNISGEMFADVQVGDQVPLAFIDQPTIPMDNATPASYIRTATVVSRDEGNITLNYGYPTIEVTVSQLVTSQ